MLISILLRNKTKRGSIASLGSVCVRERQTHRQTETERETETRDREGERERETEKRRDRGRQRQICYRLRRPKNFHDLLSANWKTRKASGEI